MNKTLNIAIIDDHKIIIDGLKIIIGKHEGYNVVAQFYSCKETLTQLDNYVIDIFILDIELPDGSGIELIRTLHQKKPKSRIIIMSLHNYEPFVSNALKNGASAYLSKHTISDELIFALESVKNNEQYISSDIVTKINCSDDESTSGELTQLTSRELQIMRGLAKGINIKSLAYDLGVQNKTIHAHRSNIYRKLNISTMKELVQISFRAKLISVEDIIS